MRNSNFHRLTKMRPLQSKGVRGETRETSRTAESKELDLRQSVGILDEGTVARKAPATEDSIPIPV